MLWQQGLSLRKVTLLQLLGSNLASVTDLKRIQTPHSLCCDFGGYKTFSTHSSGGIQLVRQAAEIKFESKFEPLLVIWKYLRRLFQKVIEGLFRRQNQRPSSWGRAPAQLGRSDGRAQTQGVSELAAVAAGSNLLA